MTIAGNPSVGRPRVSGLIEERAIFAHVSTRPARGASTLQARRLITIEIKGQRFVGHAPVAQADVTFMGNKATRISSTEPPTAHDLRTLKVRDLILTNGRTTIRVALTLAQLALINELTRPGQQ